jgi:hypothetical protein
MFRIFHHSTNRSWSPCRAQNEKGEKGKITVVKMCKQTKNDGVSESKITNQG